MKNPKLYSRIQFNSGVATAFQGACGIIIEKHFSIIDQKDLYTVLMDEPRGAAENWPKHDTLAASEECLDEAPFLDRAAYMDSAGLADYKTPEGKQQRRAKHDAYFSQYLTSYIVAMVHRSIGADKIAASTDEHFNDIPMNQWDAMHYASAPSGGIYSRIAAAHPLLKRTKDNNSVSTGTCILKQAARVIKAQSEIPNRTNSND